MKKDGDFPWEIRHLCNNPGIVHDPQGIPDNFDEREIFGQNGRPLRSQ